MDVQYIEGIQIFGLFGSWVYTVSTYIFWLNAEK